LITFLLIMALLTALVASMGLTGTMGMNVLERTREIGVMRSIGAVDWVVVKTVLIEGLTIGGISFVIGSLLSFPISSLLATIIGLAIFNTPVTLVFTPLGFATWLGLVLVLSTLASLLPARNADHLITAKDQAAAAQAALDALDLKSPLAGTVVDINGVTN
jgi:putative ABC transport system permease protein